MKYPLSLGNCDHLFCRACIKDHDGSTCPICNIPCYVCEVIDNHKMHTIVKLCQQLKCIINISKVNDSQTHREDIISMSENGSVMSFSPPDLPPVSRCTRGAVHSAARSKRFAARSKRLETANDEWGIGSNTPEPCSSCHHEYNNTKQVLLMSPHLSGVCTHLQSKAAESESASSDKTIIKTKKNAPITRKPILKSKKANITACEISTGAQSERQQSTAGNKCTDTASMSKDMEQHSEGKKCLIYSPANMKKKNCKGETLLHTAVIKKDLDKVKDLLEQGANPNTNDYAGLTPLHDAACRGLTKMVSLLLEYGADVKGSMADDSPLHNAVQNGFIDCVKLLVSYGADINFKDGSCKTPLDYVQSLEIREILKTTLNMKSNCTRTQTVSASVTCSNPSRSEARATPDSENISASYRSNDDSENVISEQLPVFRTDYNEQLISEDENKTATFSLVTTRSHQRKRKSNSNCKTSARVKRLKLLHKENEIYSEEIVNQTSCVVDPIQGVVNDNGQHSAVADTDAPTPVEIHQTHVATNKRMINNARTFPESKKLHSANVRERSCRKRSISLKRIIPNGIGDVEKIDASASCSRDIIQHNVVDQPVDIDASASTPVRRTKKNSHINEANAELQIVDQLVDIDTTASTPVRRTNINEANAELQTPSDKLKKSMCTPSPARTLKLRSGRGTPSTPLLDKKNAKGETVLHVAAIKGELQKVKKLLADGADPNTKDNAGWTPLHEAACSGNVDIVRFLLQHGAFVNAPGMENDSPLHDAVQNNKIDCVRVLISFGADKNIRNVSGCSPLDFAKTEMMKNVLCATTVDRENSNIKCMSTIPRLPIKPVLLCTLLKRPQETLVQKCADIINAEIVTDFSHSVTHIISDTIEGMCPRTIKYMQGILTGKWIVNLDWVRYCIDSKTIISEEPFEIPGSSTHVNSMAPNRGRMNVLKQLPGLFDGCKFYFQGTFKYPTPSKEELVQLVTLGGGKILNREPKTQNLDASDITVPYHAENKDSPVANCTFFKVHATQTKMEQVRHSRMATIPASWIMDCMDYFRILELPPS